MQDFGILFYKTHVATQHQLASRSLISYVCKLAIPLHKDSAILAFLLFTYGYHTL